MKSILFSLAVVATMVGSAASAQVSQTVDPLTAVIDDSAVLRFVSLWEATAGRPDAHMIQTMYLDNAGRAIKVFTPGRIESAEHLAGKIAENPQLYRDAIERCLPWLAATNDQLRSTYLGLKGLFPDRSLPQIAVVIGANNSGGTAAAGIQVIGLEVICRLSPDRVSFEERMRQFFAHETIHTFQSIDSAAMQNFLVASALAEGVPDYVTNLVTARVPNPDRDEWARAREEWIWRQFLADAAIVQAGVDQNGQLDAAAQAAYYRWFGNAGDPPEGWPDELGYWVGMRIAEAYVASTSNPHAALEDLLAFGDPTRILGRSRYATQVSEARIEKRRSNRSPL